ncbi:MAG: DUF423 domain-containing protein [Saprospiraceae bacterium]
MEKKHFILVGILGVTAVILGAFGAHGLKALISENQLETFQVGIRYHFYHMFAIFLTAIIAYQTKSKRLKTAISLFLIGIILFSGSIYLLATKSVLGIESWTFLGPITPIGGTFFIAAWTILIIEGVKRID